MARNTTAKAKSSSPVKNNGGTVAFGGNIGSNGAITQVLGRRSLLGYKDTFGGTHVIVPTHEQALNFTSYAFSGQRFAKQNPGQYIIRRVTKTICDLSRKQLYSGASDFGIRKPISYNEHRITAQFRAVTYNYVTGYPVGYSWPQTPLPVTLDQFGSDVAAKPTRAIPGYLVINTGSKVHDPATKQYGAKTE